MTFKKFLNYHDLIGHHTLLYGETDTGKTFYTSKFVQFLLEKEKTDPNEITILDFAPNLKHIKSLKIGGKIGDFYPESVNCVNLTFTGEIIPPRLNSGNKKELYKNAFHNYLKTSQILGAFNENPTPILIINDISIFLHLGNKKYLLDTIQKPNTFLGNTYYGSSISKDFARIFSLIEKYRVEYLIKRIENSIKTD